MKNQMYDYAIRMKTIYSNDKKHFFIHPYHDWLIENKIEYKGGLWNTIYYVTFWFNNKIDITAFKLMWGEHEYETNRLA